MADMLRKAYPKMRGRYLSSAFTGVDPDERMGTNVPDATTTAGKKGKGKGRRGGGRPGPGIGPPRTPLSPQPVMRAPR